MKWTVLVDNRTNDPALQTEHGLSIFLETERHRVLLDTGASDMLIHNAEQLGIDLRTVDYVFISHGHSDHAGGLKHFMSINDHARVIVSPHALSGEFFSKRLSLHSITAEWPEIPRERLLTVRQSGERLRVGERSSSTSEAAKPSAGIIADGLYVIANIPHLHPMPKGNRHLYVLNPDGEYILDDFRHELALYTEGFLFTGCAHNGLENILSACPFAVKTVVGGFHLLDLHETEDELKQLADRLMRQYPETTFHTSHCTGDHVFQTLTRVMADHLHAFTCGTCIAHA